ncbi:MAG: hypothetical protein DME50_04915 [Verrucomicrobia bacterium]|nr:MAG: hypothetical protein DME50_04915 [Verrucomicrobiota bacterium]
MTVVGLVRTQLLIVLIQRDRHRARAQGESMAEEGAQRPSGDALHQRVGRIIGAQATGGEVGRADVEGCVPTGHPAPVQAERRAKPVEVEAHDDAARIGVVGQHVTHPHGISIRVVGKGHDDVVRC